MFNLSVKHSNASFTPRLILSVFIILSTINAKAQLQADFTVDKSAGCSPLNIKFTNTSTGTSPSTTWLWNFGNGNTSALKTPGATYITEKTYTVTLTAKDGANSSVKTFDIKVYKKPTVDFSVSPAKGCAPLTVNFSSAATPGDGTISNYLWDFGDGSNVQGSNYSTTSHIYSFPQNPPVTLNVTNSFGCYASLTKTNIIEAVKAVDPSFSSTSLVLCNEGETVSFTNTSTGTGTLTYSWNFGDGGTSTEQSPTYAYKKKGSYVAKLTVTSSDGCSATFASDSVRVANFQADFIVPPLICVGYNAQFINTSTRPYDKVEWYINNVNYYSGYYNGDLNNQFYQAGDYDIKLIAYYGACSTSIVKKIKIFDVPSVNGFIAETKGACGVPVTFNFKDTTTGAVSWEWKNYWNSSVFGTAQTASATYTSGTYDYIYLTVKNAAGCSTTVAKTIYYDKPNVNIYLTNSSIDRGCTGLTVGFAASPDTLISEYKWRFGDGSTSTDISPSHIYTKAGTYTVFLDYTTKNGCKGTAQYYNSIVVVDKVNFDFSSLSGTTICGNTPVNFQATPGATGWDYYWYFNESYGNYSYYSSAITYQFNYDTTYDVKLIVQNNGCRDTVEKKQYIKVLPPFPKINNWLNTCEGTRGDVRFTESSQKAEKWIWDFGDGTAAYNYTSFLDTIRHTYTKTGTYKVVLSAVNASCTVRDSITVPVLLKQKPLLSSTKTITCSSDQIDFKLSNLDLNPTPYNYSYDFGINYMQYSDLSMSTGTILINNYWKQETPGTIQNLDPGKTDLRMLLTSAYFGCQDTTNFISIKIKGPLAGFKVESHSGCFKDPVIFTDTSKRFDTTKIIKWEWDFGDGTIKTFTTAGPVSHQYINPGYYYVRLTITDADGCKNSTNYYSYSVNLGGPKADFNASAFNVSPNSVVNFYNTSSYYDYYYYSSLKWIFSDSSISTDQYPSFNYITEGVYPVKLTTYNSSTGCRDTIVKNITVRKVNSAFTFSLNYINNNSCPPVIASFRSISTNAARVSWDFGDGGVAGNQTAVSHTYNNAGMYRVVHYSFDFNNNVDSTEDFIEIKGPYALLKADTLYACTSLKVTLTAEVRNASEFTWDFGDGTVIPTTDTVAIHNYIDPGVYTPALILKDGAGCSTTSTLLQQVIVDSLAVSFTALPAEHCDEGLSIFTPNVGSLSNSVLQTPLTYQWTITEPQNTDLQSGETADHYYTRLGTHNALLQITSPYGCKQTATNSVKINQGVKASITALQKLCLNDSISFTGVAVPTLNSLKWNWDFGNGVQSAIQNPALQYYASTGQKQVSLIVSNENCSDTAYHTLMVNPHPLVKFQPADPFVCQGGLTTVTASGGVNYQWSSLVAFNVVGPASIDPNNQVQSFYKVRVTDAQNCSSTDSVLVKVIKPVAVSLPAVSFACQGSSVQLNATGPDVYKWINNTTGLNNTAIANPTATPNATSIYTVVGGDSYGCFKDTAEVSVRISPLPIVNAGEDKQLIAGNELTLAPVVSGAVRYLWSPSTYLSCTSCINPVSTPQSSMEYQLTVFNEDGCQASDYVSVKLICKDNLVYIPNAFSPNDDMRNDRFIVKGSGVKNIRSVIIYNRGGLVMFERKNISVNDVSNSWDGTYKGEPMPAGAYVYLLQTECEGGDVFTYKGTLMLVR